MAQTRLMDRSTRLMQVHEADHRPAMEYINDALRSLAASDRAGCLAAIDAAEG